MLLFVDLNVLINSVLCSCGHQGTFTIVNFLKMRAALSKLVEGGICELFATNKVHLLKLWASLCQLDDGLVCDVGNTSEINEIQTMTILCKGQH